MASSSEGRVLKRANPNTIQGKFLVGYQGWFTCGGDGPPVHKGHHGWLHWFNKPLPDGGKPTFDLWPDVSSYTPSELFPVPGLTLKDGSQALLFSSRHPLTVRRHFHWMAQHAIDGAFYQRFATQCEADGHPTGAKADLTRLRDEVLDRVRESAESEGRVWAVMYDVSGLEDERMEKVIKVDWAHLMWDKGVLDSPSYLKEDGRPVIGLWGFGFAGRRHNPDTVRNVVQHIRSVTPGGAYIIAGTPTHWRTLQGDADPNPDFLSIWYTQFDAISPWTVGRFHNEESIDRFAREKLLPDFHALQNPQNTHGRKIDYIPVVFPGGSGFNMTDGKWGLNAQARDGGRFLWRQVYHVLKTLGVKIVYGAMWDEYDEGTAFLPAVSKKRELPQEERFIALDADGYDLPPDWYMRILGFAGEVIRGEREIHEPFPVKDLQDYWSSRPKYEPTPYPHQSSSELIASGSGTSNTDDSEGIAQTFEEWCEQEKDGTSDLPPPPYTLEAEPESDPTQIEQQSQSQIQDRRDGEERPPVVPTQTRPGSVSVPAGSSERPQAPLASRPSIAASSRPPELPLGSRPGQSGIGELNPQHGQYGQINQHRPSYQGYTPTYINLPTPAIPTQDQQQPPETNWNTHPQQVQPSISNITDQFGRQSINEGAPSSTSISPSLSTSSSTSVPSTSAPSQWPPPEWGLVTGQHHQNYPVASPPPRPPSSSRPPPPPVHPARPGSRPPPSPGGTSSSSIPNSPLAPAFGAGVGGFGRPSSTSPRPTFVPGFGPSHGPGPGVGGIGGSMPTASFPQPLSTSTSTSTEPDSTSISTPTLNSNSNLNVAPGLGPGSTFPNIYPDVTQGFMNAMPFPSLGPSSVPSSGVGPGPGAGYGSGGFYMAPMGSGYGPGYGPSPGPPPGGMGFPSPPMPPPPRRYNQPPLPPPPSHHSLHQHANQSYPLSYSQYPNYAGYPDSGSQGDGAVAGLGRTDMGPGPGTGPGGMYPPHIPTRPSQSPSPSSFQTPTHTPTPTPNPNTNHAPGPVPGPGGPGGFIPGPPTPSSGPGRITMTEAYRSTLGAFDKFAGTGTRRKIEDGIGSLSSAGSKVYQKFRPGGS